MSDSAEGPDPFEGFDFSDFWDDSDYALKEYVSEPPSRELMASTEARLGYTLPTSYKKLVSMHNGGIPRKTCFPTEEPTSWAEDHVAITGILGIGNDRRYSLCGEFGSQFHIEEWGYPGIGVCICDCPSAGHDMIMLDYRTCGPSGEPEVVHVDQESGYKITFLAKDFENFICGLVSEDEFDTSEEDLAEDLKKVAFGRFSKPLSEMIDSQADVDFGTVLRNICRKLTLEKGHFSLHSDELSTLVYDLQFLLCSRHKKTKNKESYLKLYKTLIAFGDGGFRTGGYAPAFVEDWLTTRMAEKQITRKLMGGLAFDRAFEADLIQKLKAFEVNSD